MREIVCMFQCVAMFLCRYSRCSQSQKAKKPKSLTVSLKKNFKILG